MEIQCRFIILNRKDEPTPDYPKENPLFVLNSSQLVSYVGLETLC